MSYQCENCESLFFKTLETRICSENSAILYKKRCKRCKYKYLVRKAVPTGQVLQATHEEWLLARKIDSTVKAGQAKISERPKILVGEYTQKISNDAGKTGGYLHRIRRAERSAHLERVAIAELPMRGGVGHGAP